MRIIKDYRAITNGKYRLVCNVLIPIILGVILALIDIGVRKYYVTAVMLGVGAALMTAIEVMADYWGFGAICVKGCLGMDYLKTSTKGKAMLRNALTADLLVRPARIAICMVIVAVPYEIMVGNPVRLLCLSILLTANLSVCPECSGHESAVHAVIRGIGSCGYIYNDIFGIAEVYMAHSCSTGGIAAGWNICDAQTYVPQG